MRIIRSGRWLLLALLIPLIPVPQASAGVFISVGFGPPPLPVYVQPPCPEPDLIWSPGYWAYGDEGYYWVPGAWVPAPYEGALWTPPYWGWQENLYVFHPGYWGREVGYYGGINYGFGYMGIGFVGGRWHERHFEYNTAVVHVNERYIHTTYIDRTVIREHEVVRDSRVAYAGGPGGIRHDPTPDERRAMQVQHVPPTRFQEQHMQQARSDRANFYNVNHGRPQNVALARPLPAEHRDAPPALNVGARGGPATRPGGNTENRDLRGNTPAVNGGERGVTTNAQGGRPQWQSNRRAIQGNTEDRPQNAPRAMQPGAQPQPRALPTDPGNRQRYEARPMQPGYQGQVQPRPAQPGYPVQQPRSNPEPRVQQPQIQQRPMPEPRYQQPQRQAPEPRYQQQQRQPMPEQRYQQQQQRPAPEARPVPQPRQDSRQAREPRHDSRPPQEPKR